MKKSFAFKSTPYSFGPFVKCPQPEMVEAIGLAGFDFCVLDMEHTPLGPRELYPLVLAAERRGLTPVVRIPANQEAYYKWTLDLGAPYVQVPFIQSAADARYAVEQSHFSPEGSRGLCRFTRAADFSCKPKEEYLTTSNQKTKLILQVEGQAGVSRIDEILAVKGFDTLFIGPYDLSQSLGKPGQIWDPEVVQAMKGIVEACKKAGVRVGTFTDTPEGVRFWAEAGIDMIQYASDLNLFITASRKLFSEIAAAAHS